METEKPLSAFFVAIANDRISCTHISVFAALLHYRNDKGFANPIYAYNTDTPPPASEWGFPNAQYSGVVLSHRSAFDFKPTSAGHLFITYTYTRKIEFRA